MPTALSTESLRQTHMLDANLHVELSCIATSIDPATASAAVGARDRALFGLVAEATVGTRQALVDQAPCSVGR